MKMLLWAVPALLLGMQGAALADTVLPGTEIPVRPDRPIDVSRWDRGRIYPGHVARDVAARDGDLAIPHGTYAEMIVRQVGPDQYTLDLESVTVNGRRYVMATSGPQFNMPEANMNNGSGIVAGIIGAIAAANGQQVETRGNEIRVPEGAVLRFQLQQPLHMAEWADPGYSRGEYHYHHEHDWYR